MSADNWTICPKCERKDRVDKEKALDIAIINYGKVSAEEYEHAIFKARKGLENEYDPTFREDWEIGLIGDEFAVRYRGSCTNCDFAYKFDFEKQLEVK